MTPLAWLASSLALLGGAGIGLVARGGRRRGLDRWIVP